MFLQAFFWNDQEPPTWNQALARPDFARYVINWGRPGDAAIVAVSDSSERMGAAWYRRFSAADHGYGFLSEEIPELGIAVKGSYRGQRVGRRLMDGLIALAQEHGMPGLSLSVEDANSRAARLYESLGFVRVARVGTAWTMLRELST